MSAARRQIRSGEAGTGDTLWARGLEGFAPYLVNRIIGRYNRTLRAELARRGLTTSKMRTLAVLSVHDANTIAELCVYAVAEQSAMSRTLDQLEEAGLIDRLPDARDSRARRIHLTDDGLALFQTLWPSLAAAEARLFEGIGARERAQFLATLEKMLGNVREHDI